MTDFLDAYQRELDALRRLGDAFSQAHPKIAGRLRMSRDTIDDPHVERLLEGVAFLTGRVQQRLDDAYPELTETLLDILFPHYLSPLPSACITQIDGLQDARTPLNVPRDAPLETAAPSGVICHFRTTTDLSVWPIQARDTRLMDAPFAAPAHPASRRARSCLAVRLSLEDPDASLADLAPGTLRFFIDAPIEQASALLELIAGHTLGVALSAGPNDDRPTFLPPSSVRICGFEPNEALYPWPERAFSGFRLLTEYFALPQKFLFFEISGLDARTLVEERAEIDLFLYSDMALSDSRRLLQPDTLRLNCAPIVNLHRQPCRPVHLTHWQTSYPVDADRADGHQSEIWQIDAVRELAPDGSGHTWHPLYQHLARHANESPAGQYTLARRPSPFGATVETHLTPIDLRWDHAAPGERILSIDALTSDGDLPARLPFGGGAPWFTPARGLGTVRRITCLTPPTPGFRRTQRDRNPWALITHLALGRTGLTGGADAAHAMRALLSLYDVRQSEQSRDAIASLLAVDARPATARLPQGTRTGLCRGIETVLTFDAAGWQEHGLFVLACVLDRFMALHVTANAFVRTTIMLSGRVDPILRFPPRAGHRTLL